MPIRDSRTTARNLYVANGSLERGFRADEGLEGQSGAILVAPSPYNSSRASIPQKEP